MASFTAAIPTEFSPKMYVMRTPSHHSTLLFKFKPSRVKVDLRRGNARWIFSILDDMKRG